MTPNPKTEIDRALRNAGRITGWNLRKVPVRRLQLGDCTLIVVPARVFADHRVQSPAATYWREQGKPKGTAA